MIASILDEELSKYVIYNHEILDDIIINDYKELLCLASEHYDPDEYIRDYNEFIEIIDREG